MFLLLLIHHKNNDVVIFNKLNTYLYNHINIFFSKYKFFFFYINNLNLNYLTFNDMVESTNYLNIRINQNIFKKNFLKKLKKKFKKIDNFPWRLKNFILKKLVRLKQKNGFFLSNHNSKKSYLNIFLKKYFLNLSNFFSKKQCNQLTTTVYYKSNVLLYDVAWNVNELSSFSIKGVNSCNYNNSIFSKNIIIFYKNLFYSVKTSGVLPLKINTNKTYFCGNLHIEHDYENFFKNKKWFNYTSTIFFKKNLSLATTHHNNFNKNILVKSHNNKIVLFAKELLLQPLNSFFLNHFLIGNVSKKILLSSTSVNYNNYFPLGSLDFFTKNFVFKKFKENSQPIFYKYLYHYLISFLESFLKKRVFLKIKTKVSLNEDTQKELTNIFTKHRSYQSKVGRGFFFFEMLEILLISFLYKDVNLLMDWFVKTMERIQFRSHKKFISTFKFILVNYQDLFVYSNAVKGFFFDIRGKVGVAGNAKKRHFSFNVGKFSKTTKASKIEYQQQIVRTFTGALGVTMIMYF